MSEMQGAAMQPTSASISALRVPNSEVALSENGARSGESYLRRLQTNPPNIWYRGEQVSDLTVHPAFRNIVRTVAALYDRQLLHGDAMLYRPPGTSYPANRSFMIAQSAEELASITRSMKLSSDFTLGMLGRAPDYMNRMLASFAGAADYLKNGDHPYARHMRDYYEKIRSEDLCLTHTLITPQANRSVNTARQADPFLAARVKEERDDGIVLEGARMLATLPFSDEIMVFPSTLLKNQVEDAPYAYGIAVPTDSPGLKFICRESVDYGASHYDHPLGSRFDELDAVVLFKDVFVPWERVFLYQDVAHCNQAYMRTGAIVNMAHQAVTRSVAKTEYLLGLVAMLTESIAIESFQHIQEKIAEVWVNLEVMKACLRTAEIDCSRDEWGVMRPAWNPLDAARNLYPRLYPRMIEILQLIGASGLVAMPTEADVNGPLHSDIARFYQAARAEAHERIPLFKLAWDTALSAFASRQVLYERFFSGDPVRMAGAITVNHRSEITAYADRVKELLKNGLTE